MHSLRSLYISILTLMLLALVATSAFAQSATLTIGSGTGSPGETFTVPISLDNDVPIAGMQFIIFDSLNVVDVESVVKTSRTTSFTVSFNQLNNRATRVLIFTFSTATVSGSTGPIAEVTFRVRPSVFSGTTPLNLLDVVLSDADANAIPVSVTNGTVTVTGGLEPDTTPPEPPTALSATAGDKRVRLDWAENNEDDLAFYIVLRSFAPSLAPLPGIEIARVPAPVTFYIDEGLFNDTIYAYHIIAVDSSGNKSTPSQGVNATPVDMKPPHRPVGLRATPGDQQVSLSWLPNTETDLAYYIVFRGFTAINMDSIAGASAATTTYVDEGLTNGTTYFYRIVAVDDRGNKSNHSQQESAVPQAEADTTAPAPPRDLDAFAGDRRVELRWLPNPAPDLFYYVLYRSTQDDFTPAVQDSIARIEHFRATHADTGLTNGTRYYYKLVAVDFSGNPSLPGTQASTVPDAAPIVKSIIPPVGLESGGTRVLIHGESFQDGATVTFGGASADSVEYLSIRNLTARIPPGKAGLRNVTVTNPSGRSGTLHRGFLYVKVDSVTLVVRVTSTVDGQARVDTVHVATLPEGLPVIVPPQLTAPVPGLQTLYNALAGMALEIPPGVFSEDVTIGLDIRNVTVRNDSTIFAPVHGKPAFFFVRPTVTVNRMMHHGFAFSNLAAMHLTLRLRDFNPILQASGVDTTETDTLAFAYVTESGLTQEGMISKIRVGERLLIASLTRLDALAGVRQRDIRSNTAPPAIVSGPFVLPGDTAAVITWRTDKLSTGRIEYGPTLQEIIFAVEDTNFVTGHALVLKNLARQTRYYYRVYSTDNIGQTTVSKVRTFKTVTRPDIIPPHVIVAPQVLAVTQHGAVIGWTTDEQSTSTIEYGPTPDLGQVKTKDIFVHRHVVALGGLEQNTTYYALASSRDRSDNVTAFPDTILFTTLAKPDSLPPGIVRRPIVHGLTPTSAIIQWRTDEPGDSRVFYLAVGTGDTLQATNPDETLSLEHSVTLTNLSPDTWYLYAPRSTDASGNTGGFRVGRFRTPATEDTIPPVIVRGPAVLYRSDRVIAIGWVTNEISDGFVFYRGGEDSTFIPRGTPRQSRRHLVIIGGLQPGTDYTFAITSTDASGNTAVFPANTVLSKPTVPGTAARIIAVANGELTVTTDTEPDNNAPVILSGPDVIASTSTSLTFAWETDEPSDSRVLYGPGLTLTATDEDIVTSHQVTVTNLTPGTTYDFQVGSTDPGGNGPALSAAGAATTSSTPDTDPPVIVTGSVQTAVSNDRITVSWETDEPGDSFVEFGTSPGALTDMEDAAETVTAHSIVLTNLNANTTYYLRALSTDLDGNGPATTSTLTVTTTATADTVRPVIGNLVRQALATTDSTATLTVRWTTDRLATRRIEYGTTHALGTTITDGTTGTNHETTAPRLGLNTRYFFRIGSAGVNDPQGERIAYSGIDSLVTPATADTTTPAAPENLATVPGNGAVRVRWDASPSANVTGYRILRNGTAIATVGTETTYLDVSATNGQTHTYTVQAISVVGKTSDASAGITARPDITQIPTAPANGSPAPGDTVSLAPTLLVGNATPVSGDITRIILTYEFQIAVDSAFTTLTAANVGVTGGNANNPTHWQVTDAGRPGVTLLADGVRYWWRVRANDGEFTGDWSTPTTFISSASKPTGVTLATFEALDERGVVTLDWTLASGQEPAGFHVLRSLRQAGGFERVTAAIVTDDNGYAYIDRDVSVNMVYYYMLEAVSTGDRFDAISIKVSAPRQFALDQNYPNPFNPATTIRYELPQAAQVTLKLYNLLGQEVSTLVNERQEAGFHTILWNGRNGAGRTVASGVYFYRLEAGEFAKVKKMLLVK